MADYMNELSGQSYRIPYDDSEIELKIPAANVQFYMDLKHESVNGENREKLKEAVARSADAHGARLEDLIRNKRVAMIVEDATRTVPLDDLLTVLGPHLPVAEKITVLLATGTHDGENDGNYEIIESLRQHAAQFDFALGKIIIHDCHHGPFYTAGTTASAGNQILANTAIQDAEIFIVLSDMKNHYFAGYSNAIKNFVPGICAYQTVEKNHALSLRPESTFGHHPLHPDIKRRTNPLAQDMWEAYRLIVRQRPVYVVATISIKNNILWAGAGLLEPTVTEGIRQVDRLMSVQIPAADNLIVSCGGYPNDESLYSAQRALELSKNGIRQGGEVLFLAGCRNGIGPERSVHNFYDPLKLPLPAILEQYNQKYIMYAHKTYKFAQLISQLKTIHVMSRLTDQELEDIHLKPCHNAQDLVDHWIAQNPATTIAIITEGNKYAVYPPAT
jgi:nickel-dependent lactate racemase